MRDTRDRWRSGLPVPFRNRPQRPAALPHAPGGEEPRQASRSRRSNERMACETTREENALSDSGPLRPACDEEVLTYDVRVSIVSVGVGYGGFKLTPGYRSITRLCDQIVDEIGRI